MRATEFETDYPQCYYVAVNQMKEALKEANAPHLVRPCFEARVEKITKHPHAQGLLRSSADEWLQKTVVMLAIQPVNRPR